MKYYLNYSVDKGITVSISNAVPVNLVDIVDFVEVVTAGNGFAICDLDSAREALLKGVSLEGRNVSKEALEKVCSVVAGD